MADDNEQPQTSSSQAAWRKFTRLGRNRKLLKRSARKIEIATFRHAHRFIIKRLDNVRDVRRRMLAWLGIMFLLIGLTLVQFNLYQDTFTQVAAVPGGTYAEGVVGALDTMNPLFATTSAERSASKLLFASLLSYDRQNRLRGELAETWTTADDGKTYTVTLRQGLTWSDGAPLTVDDVVFTLNLIKNPQVQANRTLASNWSSITIQKLNERQILFTLPSTYAPFPHALTFGILPKHILRNVQAERLRESDFNRSPVGSGPFTFRSLQVINNDATRLVVYMNANENYVFGSPKLERFQLHTYKDHDELRKGFLTDEISAAGDLTSDDLQMIAKEQPDARISNARLDNGVFAFFNADDPLMKDKAVREALRLATNRLDIIAALGGYASTLEGPLTKDQLSTTSRQPQPNLDQAKALLESAGWKTTGTGGVRQKDGQPLQVTITAPKTGDYELVVNTITDQWRKAGVDVKVDLVSPNTIQQNVLVPRNYSVLVYELAIGADPDVFAYWHSSQAGPRGLNLANYKSGVVDDALASAQARSDTLLRKAKYETFARQWLSDVPAVALYQPSIHYVADTTVRSVPSGSVLPDSIGRYRAVEYWTVEQQRVNGTY